MIFLYSVLVDWLTVICLGSPNLNAHYFFSFRICTSCNLIHLVNFLSISGSRSVNIGMDGTPLMFSIGI
jgi:hypothetical protein